MNTRTPIAAAIIALALLALTTHADTSAAADRLAEASTSYERGIELRATGNEAQARAAFDESATRFSTLVDEHPGSADLRRNLALARINAGQLGQGIAELRRAQALAPHDARLSRQISSDLAAARARVRTRIEGDPAPAPLAIMRPLARPWLLWTGLGIMGLGWILALCRVAAPRHAPGFLTAAGVLTIGVLATISPLAALWSIERSLTDQAVLIADETTARTGPSATGFPPAFDQPLSQGVELRITERRAAWVAATLPDGQQAWFPIDSIEPLSPNL